MMAPDRFMKVNGWTNSVLACPASSTDARL